MSGPEGGSASGSGVPAPVRDPGLQPERTRMAWRRTTLSASVAAVLGLRQALRGPGTPVAVAATVLIVVVWLAFLGVAHRRMTELAAGRPPRLAPRVALAATLWTVALAVFAMAVIV
ncbi:DUF202 domain-containing protein [Streptomyces sp. NBC_00536]|uniref:DUF202 domain-containing protein n=1 Tax=Streptomyces sp. NBC_00536 TaxID=2975769 RepID=UPI002E818D03|nr:DUF202 domain-containing protein [Streptomyces sp. NBC_00536]WUC78224.1 DUF202 domain-containing protein [Streptomyces sp. NBC_00536]